MQIDNEAASNHPLALLEDALRQEETTHVQK